MAPCACCDLCGLPLGPRPERLPRDPRPLYFCCAGCRMVWSILSEAAGGAEDGPAFRASALFRQCRDLGIIPPETGQDLPAPKAPLSQPLPALPAAHHLRLELDVSGMWCPACAWVIEQALRRAPGIAAARCDFIGDRLLCDYDPARSSPQAIAEVVQRLGYCGLLPGEGRSGQLRRREFVRLCLCALLTMNVMMLSGALYSGFFNELSPEQVRLLSLPLLGLAAVVLVYGAAPLARRAAAGLVAGAPGMELLVSLAAGAAYTYSVAAFLSGSLHLYADTACMLVTLVLLGKFLESHARRRAMESLGGLSPLLPAKIRCVTANHKNGRFVAAAAVQPGDTVRVEAGEVIPVDGSVIRGQAMVDHSTLTGEALPLACGLGQRLRSGGRVVSGALELCAERVGADSTLGRMTELVQQALAARGPVNGFSERALRLFVPLVLLLAIGTGLALMILGAGTEAALLRALTVLVISCPCALGVAVPLARVAGVALAARRGMVVRDTSAFETAAGIDTVVFDKTGTLTLGRWQLLALEPAPEFSPDRLLALAAGLETEAGHPVAEAVRRAARQRHVIPAEITERRLYPDGVAGLLGGEPLRLGSAAFTDINPALAYDSASPHAVDQPLHSAIFLRHGDRLAGTLRLGDRLRPDAAAAVADLARRDMRLLLVSGDGEQATHAAARLAGIAEAHGQLQPEEKADRVRGLQQRGGRVAMVGDGLNDAPALAAATLGIGLHGGQVPSTASAAQVILVGGQLAQVPAFFSLAWRVRCRIRVNLWLAALYNLISIPVAMAGWLSPLLAVSAMLLSSLSVTLSTLTLLREAQPKGRQAKAPVREEGA